MLLTAAAATVEVEIKLEAEAMADLVVLEASVTEDENDMACKWRRRYSTSYYYNETI